MRRTTPVEPSEPIEPAPPSFARNQEGSTPKGLTLHLEPSNPFRSTYFYEQSHTGGCRSGQPHGGSGE